MTVVRMRAECKMTRFEKEISFRIADKTKAHLDFLRCAFVCKLKFSAFFGFAGCAGYSCKG